MRRVAVLGAGGFVGNRLVETYAASGNADEVAPIVSCAGALALASRFQLRGRVADAFDEDALVAALEGCTELVCAIAGDPTTIVETVRPVYFAAERAGIRRLVYLSSAVVHGQAPDPGTDETSTLSLDQPFAYNQAKIRAENLLQQLCREGGVEVVILRPAIVYGPRSQWTGGFADQLLRGTAFLADGGMGVCNAIYIDNLVHAIRLAMEAERVNGEVFLLNDRETISWRDLFAPIAEALGISLDDVPQPSSSAVIRKTDSISNRLLMPAARAAVRMLPRPLAEAQRALRRRLLNSPTTEKPSLEVAKELALLQSCRVRLPSAKAERILGYSPRVSFDEGCRRSVAWLRFAGYPVQ
jgi:nucleoside-diphosphate-sugar epimerase